MLRRDVQRKELVSDLPWARMATHPPLLPASTVERPMLRNWKHMASSEALGIKKEWKGRGVWRNMVPVCAASNASKRFKMWPSSPAVAAYFLFLIGTGCRPPGRAPWVGEPGLQRPALADAEGVAGAVQRRPWTL